MLLIPSGLGRLAGHLSPSRAGDISAARAFVSIRQTLKVTPAMAAAVTSRICEMGRRARMSLSNKTALAMIFKLAEAAERRRLNGHNQLPKIILGIRWNRGCQIASSNRCRLIPSVTKIRR